MVRKGSFVVALFAASVVGSLPAAAQCTGVSTCSTTNTANLTISALVELEMSAITTTLTPPGTADLATGYVADPGPTFVVHANQAWTLSLKSGLLNPTNFTYVGTASGVKPIGDLTWSAAVGGTFAALTATNATLASGSNTNSTAVAIFYRTLYSSNFSSARNAQGVYALPVVFTLAAP